MKIAKKNLERIIKEEIEKTMREEKGIKVKAAGERRLMTPGEIWSAAKEGKQVTFMKRPISSKGPLKARSTRHIYAKNGGWPWEEEAFTKEHTVWDNWPGRINDISLPWKQVGMDNTSFVYYQVDEVGEVEGEKRLYVVNYDVKCIGRGCS